MAIVYDKAGRYARGGAYQMLLRYLGVLAVLCLLGGLLIGITVTGRWPLLALFFAIIFAGGIWKLERKIDHQLAAWARKRIHYWRGAQVESLVAWLLLDLNNEWHIFHGIQLIENSDIDHIVVGPGGLYCISTKSKRGLFNLQPDGRVFYNNEPTGLINNTMEQTLHLKERLKGILGSDVPYITAVLAVPLSFVEFNGPQNNVWVLHQDNLSEIILNEKAGRVLSNEQIARCVIALESIAKTAKHIFRAPAYTADAKVL